MHMHVFHWEDFVHGTHAVMNVITLEVRGYQQKIIKSTIYT
jgi:hypothetical protein